MDHAYAPWLNALNAGNVPNAPHRYLLPALNSCIRFAYCSAAA